MIQILIVEDDENISKMLAATLSIGGYSYAQCGDGLEAVERITAGNYDLILLDVMLPGADKVKGLRGGAEDYIVKPFEAVELLARIEVVLRRAGKSEMRLRYGDIRVDIERHTVTKAGVPIVLTPKEFDVLVFFMRNIDVAITREQLLSNIWEYNYTGESRTVDIHVQQVRRKLGLQGKLITIPKLGYRLERRG